MTRAAQERDELADLQALWQTQPSTVDVDVAQLESSLRRRQRHTRIMMWCDWAATLAVFAVAAWVVGRSPDLEPRTLVWLVFMMVAGGVTLIASTRVRRPVWSVAEDLDGDACALIEASIRQSRASLGIVRIIYWCVAACLLLMIGWLVSDFWVGEPLTPAEVRKSWLAFVFTILYTAAFAVGAAVFARRKRAEIARWSELRAALQSDL